MVEVEDPKFFIGVEKAYIQIEKNTKGYNWKIKAYIDTDFKEMEELRKKIGTLNTEMLNYYGNTN